MIAVELEEACIKALRLMIFGASSKRLHNITCEELSFQAKAFRSECMSRSLFFCVCMQNARMPRSLFCMFAV